MFDVVLNVGDKLSAVSNNTSSPLFKSLSISSRMLTVYQVTRDVHDSRQQEDESVHDASESLRCHIVVCVQHVVHKLVGSIEALTEVFEMLSLGDTVQEAGSEFSSDDGWLGDHKRREDIGQDVRQDFAVHRGVSSDLDQSVTEGVASGSIEVLA